MDIYLAGKIGKHDWRHQLLGVRRIELGGKYQVLGRHAYVGPYFAACDHGCTHGPESHGLLSAGDGGSCAANPITGEVEGGGPGGWGVPREHRIAVKDRALAGIRQSDLVFAWVAWVENEDHFSLYGTLYELGFARGIGKRTCIGLQMPDSAKQNKAELMQRLVSRYRDLWFSWIDTDVVFAEDAVTAFQNWERKFLTRS